MYDFEKFRNAYESKQEISPNTGASRQEWRAFRTYSMTRDGVGFGRQAQSHEVAVAEVKMSH
jgi:hypothetical protein